MRIGIVCPYSFEAHGGVQSHVLGLAHALRGLGHEVGVLAPGPRPASLPDFVSTTGRSTPVRFNGSVARVDAGPVAASRVRSWLRSGEYDVLHLHEPTTSLSAHTLGVASAPVVGTFHTAQRSTRLLEASTATVLRSRMRRVRAHIAVSEEARRTLARYGTADATVIPNGVDASRFPSGGQPPGRQPPGRSAPTLLFVGRVDEPRKGLPVALAAMPEVLRAHPGARLLVAGGGSPDRRTARLVGGLGEGVAMLGAVDETEKARLLATCDVLVAPNTRGESFGIVLAEAMVAGAAVLASDLPAFAAVLGHGRLGALFATGDPTDLAAHAVALLDDPAHRRRLAARARVAARRDYDWASVAPRVEAVYRSVLPGDVIPSGRRSSRSA
jgi:phosphatidylinositol alpha-mannosyltransferase